MLKYKPATQIFDSVAEDFKVYDDEGLIDYSTFIKVIKHCNSKLSLKINPESNKLITITDYKGKLPDNFKVLNLALACTKRTIEITKPSGFQVEQVTTSKCDNKCTVCLEECDVDFKIIQKCNNEFVTFDNLDLVRVVNTKHEFLGENCLNYHSRSYNEIKIQGDYIQTNFREGSVYIEYTTTLEDRDGVLLVLDDDMVQPYYEWACKKQALSNMLFNNDDAVGDKYKIADFELKNAKVEAIQYVNAIEYNELMGTLIAGRQRFQQQFSKPFRDEGHYGYNKPRYF